MRIGSLFAGIGGFDLAARWMGWETAWFSEVDPYASAVLAKHWPGVPNHGDITTIDFSTVEPVDMLCGGFPCQDISNAGKRKGITGERSGLWSEYARAIGDLRPRYVVVENVAALLGRGLERVLGDLAALGYDAEWEVLSAADVGAPHQRDRLWITAYAHSQQHEGRSHANQRAATPHVLANAGGERCIRSGFPEHGVIEGASGGEPDGRGAGGRRNGSRRRAEEEELADANGNGRDGARWDVAEPGSHGAYHGLPLGSHSWTTEPDVGRVAHGIPARMDRLRCLGNAIVPQCAFVIFSTIQEAEVRRKVLAGDAA